MRIPIVATALVTGLGLWRELTATRWALLLATGGVWVSEVFNTALERLCNVVSPEYHSQIRQVRMAQAEKLGDHNSGSDEARRFFIRS